MAQIPQHRHCRECMLAVPKDETFCSGDCERAYEASSRRKRQYMLFYYIGLMVSIGLLVLLMFGGG